MKHVRETPEPPSARLGRPISPGLEAFVLRCLAKPPAERPADAAAALRELALCETAGGWTPDDAAAWWAAPPAPAAAAAARAPEAVETRVTPPAPALDRTMDYERE